MAVSFSLFGAPLTNGSFEEVKMELWMVAAVVIVLMAAYLIVTMRQARNEEARQQQQKNQAGRDEDGTAARSS